MKIISINRAHPEPLQGKRGKPYSTGIFKHPVHHPVRITREGLPGDFIGNHTYHGGPDQALYLYALSDYHWWETTLGHSLEPGCFGENLTLSELDHTLLAIGDRFRIGDVLLEITAPRIPCSTLSRRMNDHAFLKKFRAAARPGPYCRVLHEGDIQSGDPVSYEPCTGDRLSLLEIYHAEFTPPADAATLRRHLAAPLATRFRLAKEKTLASLTSSGS